MRTWEPSGTIGVAIAAAMTMTPYGCDGPPAANAGRAQAKAVPVSTKVEVIKPTRQAVRRTTEEPGQIEAAEVTPIHAKLSGYARTVAVDIGDRVKKGQVLAELWVPEVEADLEQKRAMIAQAEAKRAQAEAAVKVAQAGVISAEAKVAVIAAGTRKAEADLTRWQSEFNRTQQLVSDRAATGSLLDETRGKLGASEAARDAVRAEVKSAQATLTEAQAALDQARSDVVAAASGVEVARAEARRAEALLAYAKIEAPFDGVVTRRNVDTGHLTVTGPEGEPLFIVARTDVVTLAVGVPEMEAAAVEPGDGALVRLQALGGRTVEAKVSRTSYTLDASTRTLRAEIDLPNTDGTLRPGLYAYATIIAEEHPNALTLPTTAVVREGAKPYCVRVVGGRAVRQPLAIGLDDGTRVEVLSGLKGDEIVVQAGAAALADGQPVDPVEAKSVSGPKP